MNGLIPRLILAVLFGVATLAAQAAGAPGSALLGAVVLDREGKELGTIGDLAVDVEAGSVAYAIVHYRDPGALRLDVRPLALTDLRPGLAREHLVFDPSAAAGGSAAPRADARLLRASTVLGMKIDHPTGASYGVIDDIVVDLDTAKVQHALVRLDADVDGGKREVPFSALRFPAGSGTAVLTLGMNR